MQVTLTTANPQAAIHYTLNGCDPTTNATAYSGPLSLDASVQVRAAAFLNGTSGPVASATYVISTNPPNIVLFIAEDVGVGDLHQYGNPVHATPHLDTLGRSGLRFTQVYCTGTSNAPNQYAALTGRLLPRSGLPPFLAPGSGLGLPPREWALGKAFRKSGRRTAFIGGWHLGDNSASLPHHQGFELFYGLIMPLEGQPLANLRENDSVLESSPNATNLFSQFVARALAFLDANATSRFLLVLQVPPLPALGTSLGGDYGNRIEALDAALGQITEKLDDLGIRNDTLLVFVSDEGPELTPTLPRGSAGLFRDGRGTTYEGGVRIPAYANWPGTILPGGVSQAVWWLPDLLPTLCAVSGLTWPTNRPLDGLNRAAALMGATMRPTGTENLFFHRQTGTTANLAAERIGVWKHHRSLTKTDPENSYTTAPLLFHIERDPGERFPTNNTTVSSSISFTIALHLGTFQPPYPQLPFDDDLVTGFKALPTDSSNPPVQLVFTRPADTLDDYYAVEHSTDLLNWTAVPLTSLARQILAQPSGSECVTLTPPSPAPDTNQLYFRLRATLP